MKEFLNRPTTRRADLIVDAIDSFPMGVSVSNIAHPDMQFLSQMDGVIIDLRVLFLSRDPVDCILSSVRRFEQGSPYKDYKWQARCAQDSLTTINNAIPLLKCGKLLKISYEV